MIVVGPTGGTKCAAKKDPLCQTRELVEETVLQFVETALVGLWKRFLSVSLQLLLCRLSAVAVAIFLETLQVQFFNPFHSILSSPTKAATDHNTQFGLYAF
jgi:hypothetical protein